MKLLRTLGLLAVFASTLPAQAALVDMGTFVRDDVAMVDYLKLSETAGLSWIELVEADTTGLIAAGWGVTSQAALFILDANHADAYDYVNDIATDLVVTNEDMEAGQPFLPNFVVTDSWTSSGDYNTTVSVESASADDPPYTVSLSREVANIPLPAAGYLLFSALLGLAGMKRVTRK